MEIAQRHWNVTPGQVPLPFRTLQREGMAVATGTVLDQVRPLEPLADPQG